MKALRYLIIFLALLIAVRILAATLPATAWKPPQELIPCEMYQDRVCVKDTLSEPTNLQPVARGI